MLTTLALACWIVLGVLIGRIAAGHALYSARHASRLGGDDKLLALGTLLGAIIVWPAIVFGWVWNHKAESFLHTPPAEREHQEQERMQRIDKLIAEAKGEQTTEMVRRYDRFYYDD